MWNKLSQFVSPRGRHQSGESVKMAEAGSPVIMESSLINAAKCTICYDFMTDSRTLLDCMHTFCSTCINQVSRKRHGANTGITCPLCRKFVKESHIKSNPLTNGLIELISSNAESSCEEEEVVEVESSPDMVTCIVCSSQRVTTRCLHCEVDLCHRCAERHTRLPVCKEHTLVPVVEAEQRTIAKRVTCLKHKDELIKMNCSDCDTVICSHCKFEEHDTHQSETLEVAIDKHMCELKALLDTVWKNISRKKKLLQCLDTKCQSMCDNNALLKATIQEHKEDLTRDILTHLEKEYDKLCTELDEGQAPLMKALQEDREELELSLSCDKSLMTWVTSITKTTDGISLLREIQSGLIDNISRVFQEEQDREILHQEQRSKRFQFDPGETDINKLIEGILGNVSLTQCPDESSNDGDHNPEEEKKISEEELRSGVLGDENETDSSLSSDGKGRSFRSVQCDLSVLHLKNITHQKTVSLGNNAFRICMFQNQLWIPCPKSRSILMYSLDGEYEGCLQLDNISKPRSLHPLNEDILALASESGLFILDSLGKVNSHIISGNIDDVYVEDNMIAALLRSLTEQKVYIWDVGDTSEPLYMFDVTLCRYYYNTLSLIQSSVYICIGLNSILHKYTPQGELLDQHDIESESLHQLMGLYYLCCSDAQGNMLVICNQRLQVLCGSDNKETVTLDVSSPQDALVNAGNVYILHEGQISIFNIN